MTKYRIAVCKGPDCRRGGSDRVFQAARAELVRKGLLGQCELYRGGCYGLCHLGPNVVVRVDTGKPRDFLSQEDFQLMGWEGEVHYGAMTPEGAVEVVDSHVGAGRPVDALRGPKPE